MTNFVIFAIFLNVAIYLIILNLIAKFATIIQQRIIEAPRSGSIRQEYCGHVRRAKYPIQGMELDWKGAEWVPFAITLDRQKDLCLSLNVSQQVVGLLSGECAHGG